MYSGVAEIFGRYWRSYGGAKALFGSAYLHISFLLTLIAYPVWSKPDWWQHVLSILPNLLGFTIGGFTIFLGIGSERFRSTLADSSDGPSIMMQISASYVHFIVIQTIALISALMAQATAIPTPDFLWSLVLGLGFDPGKFFTVLRTLGWGFCYLMFLYAISLVLAACMAVFRTAGWAEQHR